MEVLINAPGMQRKLQTKSKYAKYDLNQDGVVDDSELSAINEIEKAEAQSRKLLAQRRMATATLTAMGMFTAAMFFVDIETINALSDISNLFYISGAGIVGAYMGTSAYMSKK